ncbi:amidohydrolase family protein [Arsukibacterium indicum]|uniref:Amidohydrolase family protein n=1 Tax=Arsukibacterium indicum TaxID=2848612 RepID=A0ABS6MN57_9GAMM|nr:amidohydrolase family protein [Arsukibacterium indicum]MBV2130244.1 amidohydrolase family protein [Arsukibacterium indicum]
MRLLSSILLLFISTSCLPVLANTPERTPSAPERIQGEGDGPYKRLILRGGILISGEGAPAIGPVDIVIENDRISQVTVVGYPDVPVLAGGRPVAKDGDTEMDVSGMYILPGFIDMHGHIGGSANGIPAEYVFKLWLAHGITTVREPGSFNGLAWTLKHVKASAENQIVAPRIVPYVGFGQGLAQAVFNPEQARKWVRDIKKAGAAGIKFFGATPGIIAAALEEANKQQLGTMMHHAQLNVARTNVLDSARMGLGSMEHWYGLPEALFTGQTIQNYPANYNYQNEQDRFGAAGELWRQAAKPGSEKWNAVRDELIALDFTINPTLTIYEASRDAAAQRNAEWHQQYTLPTLTKFFTPSRYAHGSYWFDWTTDHEIAWRENYRIWMQFLNDYKNHGGRITVGSDAGYIYKIYGFAFVQELELLREAGFNALEVVQAATLNGALALGLEQDIGSVVPGKKADLVIVAENPLANFKVLYGTGHYRLNTDNQAVRTQGVRYTIKDGIVYDAQLLLADVRNLVALAKQQETKP